MFCVLITSKCADDTCNSSAFSSDIFKAKITKLHGDTQLLRQIVGADDLALAAQTADQCTHFFQQNTKA